MQSVLQNPIIRRELIGTLRTGRALAAQCALVLVLTTLVVLRWPSDARVDIDGAEASQVLRVLGYGLTTILILLAPVFPATGLVSERQKGTLALLLNSPMKSWEIAIGKITGSFGFIILLLILSLPAAAACFAMGGVDLVGQLGKMYMVLALLALMYTTLGLFISSYAQTTDSALRMTYGVILVLAVGAIGPYQFFRTSPLLSEQAVTVIEWIRCLSPLPAMAAAMGDTAVGSAGVVSGGDAAMRFALLSVICSAVFTALTIRRLQQRMLDRSRAAGKVTDERSAGARVFRRIMYLWFFDPQRRTGLIGPFTNPVMIKEQRCRRFGRGHWMMRMILGCLIISLGLVLMTLWRSTVDGVGTLGGIMVLLQISLLVLITPSLASGIISGEVESKGWQLLQSTPLSATTIVIGKLMSVMLTLLLLIAATLPAYAVLILIDPGQKIVAIKVMVSLVLTAGLALMVSAAVSSLFKRTAVATAVSYSLLVGLCAGTLLFWLAQDAPFSHATVEAVLQLNPLAAALNLIEAPGFTSYDLVPTNWWVVGGMCLTCVIILIVRTWQLTRPR